MDSSTKKVERPLSPHLQVYKPQLTSVMSIFHRITGYALAVGTLPFIWLLMALASGPEAFYGFMEHAQSWYGLLLLFGWSFSLFYHMCNGIRHLFWDLGFCLDIKKAYSAGYTVWVVSFVLTAGVWYFSCPLH